MKCKLISTDQRNVFTTGNLKQFATMNKQLLPHSFINFILRFHGIKHDRLVSQLCQFLNDAFDLIHVIIKHLDKLNIRILLSGNLLCFAQIFPLFICKLTHFQLFASQTPIVQIIRKNVNKQKLLKIFRSLLIADDGALYTIIRHGDDHILKHETGFTNTRMSSEHIHITKRCTKCQIIQDRTIFTIADTLCRSIIAFAEELIINFKCFNINVVSVLNTDTVQDIVIVIIDFLICHFCKAIHVGNYIKALIIQSH